MKGQDDAPLHRNYSVTLVILSFYTIYIYITKQDFIYLILKTELNNN